MKRRIMCRSQRNRQPGKADLFHETFVDSWDAIFFFLSFAAECSFDYYLYSFGFVYQPECLSAVSSSFGTDVLWRVYDPCRETLNAIREGWMCGCLGAVCWHQLAFDECPAGLLREKEERLFPRCVLIALHLSPIIRPIELHRIPFERSIR